MAKIRCPKCGEEFNPSDKDYEEIVKEVRSQEFEKELKRELDLQKEKFENQSIKNAQGYKEEIAKLKAELFASKKDNDIALLKATQAQELQIKSLEDKIKLDERKYKDDLKDLEERNKILLKAKQDEVDFYKDLKAKASTKMLGETLEQHCEVSFNQVRSMAFPNAYFEKDNLTPDGTKGDYIFKESTSEGAELLSIMFEMKNEGDTTATKHKNEDFFAKLDKDRKDKGCEFAVLVSLLEADNEYYNTGIVEVAPSKYEKMYVIRPQFFIPLISLLRNMALRTIDARNELVAFRNREVDLTKLDEEINDFKDKFGKNITTAVNKFQTAIDEIDKSIAHLQKIRDALTSSNHQLALADNKLEDLSAKKLLKHSPSLKEEYNKIEKENK